MKSPAVPFLSLLLILLPVLALAYIRSQGGAVRLEEGRISVTFEWATRERREACHKVARRYNALLRLQLDVGPGEMPRTAQQLVAAGKIRIEGRRYKVCDAKS